MVQAAEAYALGLVPGEVEDHEAVQAGLGRLLGVPAATIRARYEFAVPDQYLAMGEVGAEQYARASYVSGLAGVRVTPYTSRFYYGQGAAAHVTGYTSYIQPEELAEFQARGYSPDQRIGSLGLEGWGEAILAGQNGGQLTLLDAAGQPLRAIVLGESTDSQDLYTTLDFDLQQAAQFALGDFEAAAVVMRVDTGEVLALVSNPTFDPNLFDPNNLNFQFADAGAISAGLLNRATQDAYPAGSIFKIVTLSAGLTSGLFIPETEYTCNGRFEEVPGFVGLDWREEGHGTLSLVEGLSGSCNPWFWHIGRALFEHNPQWLPDTARGFGLGQITGLEVLAETPGRIPDPAWKLETQGQAWEVLDSLNLAIGQGDVLVTPLQVARLVAAVGNAGTLMRPQLVHHIAPPGGEPTFTFRPEIAGQLPLDEAQLTALQTGMHNVTREPIGTARDRFRGFRIPIAGKTGTAETGMPGLEDPDAWFAGYTMANREDRPDIAVAVWAANRGQGSDFAAPIFRRIVEAYFGLPFVRYPWEESVGVVATPEPTGTPEGAMA
jgi:penicillin-binding protein 2